MTRTSTIDALIWVRELKKRNMIQFEYRDLPDGLRDLRLLRRAKEESLIFKVKKNEDGINVWRIADKIKCEQEEIEEIKCEQVEIE